MPAVVGRDNRSIARVMSPPESRPPTNYRRIRRRSERAFLWLVVGVLLIVGGGLIWALYGGGGLITGLLCLFPGAGLILLLWGALSLLERWAGE